MTAADAVPIDPYLDAEYDNRARVPEHPGIIAQWAKDAAVYREAHPPVELAYGAGPRERMDLFAADDETPVVLFIHGGYWQALDKSFFSHMAAGLSARGVSVAVTSYDLCPHVALARIVAQMREAVVALRAHGATGIVAAGHSAGGHLAACLCAQEPGTKHAACVNAAYCISGLFDLRPLAHTKVNVALGLNEAEAMRLSPLFWQPSETARVHAVVGGNESSEYHRQSRTLIERWHRGDRHCTYGSIDGTDHFTVIAPLADPHSSMTEALYRLTRSD